MDKAFSKIIKKESPNDALKILIDEFKNPVFSSEMDSLTIERVEYPYYCSDDTNRSHNAVNDIAEKITISAKEYKCLLKNIITSMANNYRYEHNKVRYICGSAALFLYMLRDKIYTVSEDACDDDGLFWPLDIDFMLFSDQNSNGTRRFIEPNFIKCEQMLNYFNFNDPDSCTNKTIRVKYQVIYKNCSSPSEFVKNFDISVAKIIYDIEEDSFDLTDQDILDDINSRKARYFNQPFNFYLARNGEKLMISRAIKRIMKYHDRGFKFDFDVNVLPKLLAKNFYLENTNRYMTKEKEEMTPVEMLNYLIAKCSKYGFEKTKKSLASVIPTISQYTRPMILAVCPEKQRYIDLIQELTRCINEESYYFASNKIFRPSRDIDTKKFIFSGSTILYLLSDKPTFEPGDLDIWIDFNISDFIYNHSKLVYAYNEFNEQNNLRWEEYHPECNDENGEKLYNDLSDIASEGRWDFHEYYYKNFEYCKKEYGMEKRLKDFFTYICECLHIESNFIIPNCSNYSEEKSIVVTIPYNDGFKIQFIVSTKSLWSSRINPVTKRALGNNMIFRNNSEFDMGFCRAFLYPKELHSNELLLYMDDSTEKSIREMKSDYRPKRHNFTERENDLVLNDTSRKRVEKYISRGYKLFYMGKEITDPSDVVIPNGVNENLNYYFLNFTNP